MMKYFLILMTFLGFTCEAQNTFNKRFDFFHSWGDYGWSLQADSTNIWAVFGTLQNGGLNLPWSVGLLKLDYFGNVLDTNFYSFPNESVYAGGSQSLNKANHGYILGGSIGDAAVNSDALLIRIKEDGDTLWTKKIGDGRFQSGWMAKQDDDGGFLLCGQTNISVSPYNSDALLVKTDSLGNLIWERHYGDSLDQELAFTFTKTIDGGFVLAGNYKDHLSTTGQRDIWITKTDSLGVVQWDTTIYTPYLQDDQIWSVISTQDGNIVCAGNLNWQGSNLCPYFLKLDLDGDVIWEKQYFQGIASAEIHSIMELPDGCLIATGKIGVLPSGTIGFLLKLNSIGDIVWSNNYQIGAASRHAIEGVYATPDGGFVLNGTIFAAPPDTGHQDLWILKVDSMGCEIANCIVDIKELQSTFNSINIYPVPFSSELNVSIKDGFGSGEIKVFDSTGRLVIARIVDKIELQFDTSQWQDGIYMIQVSDKNGSNASRVIRIAY